VKEVYDQKEVAGLLGISESQVRYWDRTGLIPHVEKNRGKLLFDFRGLVSFRAVKELLDKGFSMRKIRKSLEKIRERYPDIGSLNEITISTDGGRIVINKDRVRFTPEGQILMDFQAPAPADVPAISREADYGEERFFTALETEEEGHLEEAARIYADLLRRCPDHTDALVNMGNIHYISGFPAKAESCYRTALLVDPDHVEANFNLATLLEEREDFENAALFYRKSAHEDPDYADAHFDLARILEKLGEKDRARKHWVEYLKLEPDSEWVEYVKSLLDS